MKNNTRAKHLARKCGKGHTLQAEPPHCSLTAISQSFGSIFNKEQNCKFELKLQLYQQGSNITWQKQWKSKITNSGFAIVARISNVFHGLHKAAVVWQQAIPATNCAEICRFQCYKPSSLNKPLFPSYPIPVLIKIIHFRPQIGR